MSSCRTRTHVFSILSVAALMACGCSGGADAQGADVDASKANVQIEVFSWWTNPGESEALQALVDLHNRNFPREHVFNAADPALNSGVPAREVLRERIEQGDPPDLFQNNLFEMRDFIRTHPGSIAPLDELFAELKLEDAVAPEIVADLTIDGHVSAMPVNAHRENTLFYGKQVFAANDLQPPQTWDELLVACDTLRDNGVTPLAISVTQPWIINKLFSTIVLSTLGPAGYRDYFYGSGAFDETKMAEAVDTLDRVLERCVDMNAATQDNYGWPDAAASLYRRESAMFIHGDWVKGYLVQQGWTPEVDFGAVGSPGATDVFLYGVDVFGLPEGAKHPQEAAHFLTTIASNDGQVAFNTAKGSTPMRLDTPTKRFDVMGKAVAEDFRNAAARIGQPKWPLTWDAGFAALAQDHDQAALMQTFKDDPVVP